MQRRKKEYLASTAAEKEETVSGRRSSLVQDILTTYTAGSEGLQHGDFQQLLVLEPGAVLQGIGHGDLLRAPG